MPSTYSSNLKLELMATGENSGTWGNITNTNLGTAAEQAIVGYGAVSYASDANLTISITNSNAAQAARALVLNVTSAVSLTGTRELVVPTIEKQYIVQNNTTGSQSITVKTSAGTGITVPNGRKAHLYVNGTDVIQMFDFVDINGGAIDGTTIGAASASTGAFTTLNASGATTLDGNVALGNASGDLITFPGTINSHLLFTDNTYDIGANGATRPRNLFLAGAATIGGNLSVGGTLTLTGGLILNGNVTVGDTSADTLTINATITSNLLFTDNTYDIGASGATRPRNLFLAGNATIGGNQTLTGSLTVDSTTDSSSTTTGSIQTDGGLGVAKALYVGTTANIAGNVTLSGGTANGVAYLNGSKVLTTGSALTFDGTEFKVGASSGNVLVQPSNVANAKLYMRHGSIANNSGFEVDVSSNIIFLHAGSEQMRLTSTGLGIGTSSPIGRLEAVGGTGAGFSGWFRTGDATAANNAGGGFYNTSSATATSRRAVMALDADGANLGGGDYFVIEKSGNSGTVDLLQYSNAAMRFGTNFTSRAAYDLTLDSSGNLGLGQAPAVRKFEINAIPASLNQLNGMRLQMGGVPASAAEFLLGTDGVGIPYTSIRTGSDGNSYMTFFVGGTERGRIAASGNWLLGTTTDAGRLTVNGNVRSLGGNFELDTGQVTTNSSSNPLILGVNGAEWARLTSAGYLGLNTASPTTRLSFAGGTSETLGTSITPSGWNNARHRLTVPTAGDTSVWSFNYSGSAVDYSGYATSSISVGQAYIAFATGAVNTAPVTIATIQPSGLNFPTAASGNANIDYNASAMTLMVNSSSAALRFGTNSAERARFDSSGDFMIGTTSSSGRLTVVTGAGSQAALFTSGSGTTQQAIATFSNITNSGYLSIAGVGTTSSVGTWTNGSMVVEGVPNSSGNTFIGSYTGDLVFQNGRVNSGRFTSGGAFLIGQTSTLTNEYFRVSGSGQASMLLDNTGKTNGAFVGVFNDAALLGVNRNPSTGVFYNASNWAADIVVVGSSTNSYIAFETAAAANTTPTERARILSGGEVLIGATALSSYFDGKFNVAGRIHTKINNAADSNHVVWNEATSGDNGFVIFGTEATYTIRGSIDYNRAGGLTRYNTTSDYRAKDIIGPVQNPGATIDALKVYEGKMKGATQSRPMLVAHEAQAHAPYAVSGVKDELNKDGSPKFQQMDVSSLVPLLLAEIQSLRARVAALES